MKVLHIARNTFRECVRDKVLYNLVIFAVLDYRKFSDFGHHHHWRR